MATPPKKKPTMYFNKCKTHINTIYIYVCMYTCMYVFI